MPDDKFALLPTSVPISLAAKLVGLSAATFKARVLDPGIIALVDGRVPLAALSRYLGEPVDMGRFFAADRKRDKARAAQRRYRARMAA